MKYRCNPFMDYSMVNLNVMYMYILLMFIHMYTLLEENFHLIEILRICKFTKFKFC